LLLSEVVVPVVPVAVVALEVELEADEELEAPSLPVTCTLWPTCVSRSEVLPSSLYVTPGIVDAVLAVPVVPVACVPVDVAELDDEPMRLAASA